MTNRNLDRGTSGDAITDSERILEIFHVQDMAYELEDQSYAQGNHSADMLMLRRHHTQGSAYFPTQLVSAGSTSVAQTHVTRRPYHTRIASQHSQNERCLPPARYGSPSIR